MYLNQYKKIALALGSSIGLCYRCPLLSNLTPHPPNNRTNKNLKIKTGRREEKNEHSQLGEASFPSEPPVIVTGDHGKPGSLIIGSELQSRLKTNRLTKIEWSQNKIVKYAKLF